MSLIHREAKEATSEEAAVIISWERRLAFCGRDNMFHLCLDMTVEWYCFSLDPP